MSPSSRRAWIEINAPAASSAVALVALLAEGVDRNKYKFVHMLHTSVALLAEGVDRNNAMGDRLTSRPVALLAEGVDRNSLETSKRKLGARSPSSRRAWIEMQSAWMLLYKSDVALLAEGVDRNQRDGTRCRLQRRRPPRGGRG